MALDDWMLIHRLQPEKKVCMLLACLRVPPKCNVLCSAGIAYPDRMPMRAVAMTNAYIRIPFHPCETVLPTLICLPTKVTRVASKRQAAGENATKKPTELCSKGSRSFPRQGNEPEKNLAGSTAGESRTSGFLQSYCWLKEK